MAERESLWESRRPRWWMRPIRVVLMLPLAVVWKVGLFAEFLFDELDAVLR